MVWTEHRLLRQMKMFDLKKVIDQILHAGLNENDRQRHLDNY